MHEYAIDCTCMVHCGEGDGCGPGGHTFDGDCTACSHTGRELHSHEFSPYGSPNACPVHPDLVVG